MAPVAYRNARLAQSVLGIGGELELYQRSGGENTAIHLVESPILVEIHGRLLPLLDEGALLGVFGHELGHFLAHGPRSPSGVVHLLTSVIGQPDLDPQLEYWLSTLSMIAELTADRVGLVACQDLHAMLRLEMIALTGLSADVLRWDTDTYLAQSCELMESVLERGERVLGRTHPEHSLRAYALWLFSETDVYRELTGTGPGTRRLNQVDDLLWKFFITGDAKTVEPGYHMLDEPPRELHECALAASVIVAHADGDFADEEAEAIERIFAPLVGGWHAYLDLDHAVARFWESAKVVEVAGGDLLRALFNLLVHVMGADGVIDPAEVRAILAVGQALGCEDEYRLLLGSTLLTLRVSLTLEDLEPEPLPLPVTQVEAADAFEAFVHGVQERGEAVITLRRLLRLLGYERREQAVVQDVARALKERAIEADKDLALVEMDRRVHLTALVADELQPGQHARDASREGLRVALTRMRDLLVSGDGRSPSVRLRKIRHGRSFDLSELNSVSVGAAERALTRIRSGKRAVLVQAEDAGQHRGAEKVAGRLKALSRENRLRVEETGANDLYVGYPFLTGNVAQADGKRRGTYLVRGPLVLYPADLVETAKGARGYAAVRRADETAMINQSLLRLIFNKRGYAFPDELSDELDALAGDPSKGLEAVLARLGEVGLKLAHRPGPLSRFQSRDEELEQKSAFLELEETAVLGMFPQSNSDLLQDYDGLIAELALPKTDLSKLLASAQLLLPDGLQPKTAIAKPEAVAHDVRPPVVPADPSQRQVIAMCRQNPATVVDGPPGTGKSQVIVNLVADALARGERVAVVCEKRAAIDVVCQRLESLGLRHLVGLVHDVNDDRRGLYDQIAQRVDEFAPVQFDHTEATELHREHQALKSQLAVRDALLSSSSAAGEVTIGELATMASDTSSALLTGELGLDSIPTRQLRELNSSLLALQPLADVWSLESPWRNLETPRASFAKWSRTQIGELEAQLRSASLIAERYAKYQTASPVSGDVVEGARTGLQLVVSTTSARTDAHQSDLFSHLLNIAVARPAQLLAGAKAQDAWRECEDAIMAFTHPIKMTTTPEFEHTIRVLHRWVGNVGRFFVFGWWVARSRVRKSLKSNWPEKSAAPIDTSLLEQITTRLRAASGWRRLEDAMAELGIASALPQRSKEARAFVHRLATLSDRVQALAHERPPLDAARAWLPQAPAWEKVAQQQLGLLEARDALATAAAPLRNVFPWLTALPSAEQLATLATGVAKDGERLVHADRLLTRLGSLLPSPLNLLDGLYSALRDDSASAWKAAVRRSWAVAWLAQARRDDPRLEALGTEAEVQETLRSVARFAELEAEISEVEVERVVAKSDDVALLKTEQAQKHKRRTEAQKTKELFLKETRKKRRLMPLRSFVRRFSRDGLLDVVPVWLLSPETMTVLFPRNACFDLVIFDEASQCTVASGFPVLLRAKRVVIAGDEKQMPPSSYFSLATSDDEEATEEIDEETRQLRDMLSAESLLTLARTRVAHAGLTWHYRCQDEALIAFSNHSMYHGDLLTIPATTGPSAKSAIRWVKVEDGDYQAGENKPEAERVVDVVGELLSREKPPSVGVVTFNLRQRRAVLDAIDVRCESDEAFANAWETACSFKSLDERPFVKNLEQVQGDERDVIVFSLGHAPKERIRGGKPTGELYVPARFGPLGQRGGERRLNVAVSRAKKECVIISSFDPKQLTVGKTKHEGPKLFSQFLGFAHHMSGGHQVQAERVLDLVREARRSPHRRDRKHVVDGYLPLVGQLVAELEKAKVPYELDVGSSGFRVPLAIPHANDPARFALAVIIDEGAEPMSPFERYVHRPAVLRLRGWDVMHVTSNDWMVRRAQILREIFNRVPGIRGAHDSEVFVTHRRALRSVANAQEEKRAKQRRKLASATQTPSPLPKAAITPVAIKDPPQSPQEGPDWVSMVEDAKFRRALLHLDTHGMIGEVDLLNMVGGARRARKFTRRLDDWKLPFEVRIDGSASGKIFLKT